MEPLQSRVAFVAYLDILGFTKLVQDQPEVVGDVLEQFTAISSEQGSEALDYLLFSDLIILYTKDDSELSFQEILSKVADLQYKMLERQIPIRGCISHGHIKLLSGSRGHIIAGSPIIDAYQYEGRQQWVGVMLSPGRLKSYEGFMSWYWTQFRSPFAGDRKVAAYKSIPLKDSSGTIGAFSGYAVVPNLHNKWGSHDYSMLLRRIEMSMLQAPDVAIQAKYNRTLEFLTGQHKELVMRMAGNG